jgi:hypothetical protein
MLSESATIPPPELHDQIVQAIAAETRPAAGARGLSGARAWIPARVIAAFVAGAAAAALIVVSVLRGPTAGRDPGGAPESGTMAPLESTQGEMLTRAAIVAADGRADFVTRRAGDQVWLEVHARLGQAIDLEFEFPSDALDLTGVRWSRAGSGQLAAGPGRLKLPAQATGDVILLFRAHGASDAPVTVRAGAAGSVVLRTAPPQQGG